MTRNELLKRLQQMKRDGENMDLEIVVRVNRRVPDKRTRTGQRFESLTADLKYACSGQLTWDNDSGRVRKSELLARVRDDWVGKWH